MAVKEDQLKSLKKISTIVNENNQRLWENEAHHSCLRKEIEKIKEKTERAERRMEELDKEDAILEKYLDSLTNSLTLQQKTLAINQQSLINQQVMKHNAEVERNERKKRCAAILDEFKEELVKQRTDMENQSGTYQILKAEQLELRRLKIDEMELVSKIEEGKEIKRQFDQIQQRRYYTTMVEFAQIMVDYSRCEEQSKYLQKLKVEEKEALKEFLELEEALKQASKARSGRSNQGHLTKDHFAYNENQAMSDDLALSAKNEPPADNLKDDKLVFSQKLEDFMIQDLEPLSQFNEDQDKFPKQSDKKKLHFSSNNAKVRILDVHVTQPNTTAAAAAENPEKKRTTIANNCAKKMTNSQNRDFHKSYETFLSQNKSRFFKASLSNAVAQQPNKKSVTFKNDCEMPTSQESKPHIPFKQPSNSKLMVVSKEAPKLDKTPTTILAPSLNLPPNRNEREQKFKIPLSQESVNVPDLFDITLNDDPRNKSERDKRLKKSLSQESAKSSCKTSATPQDLLVSDNMQKTSSSGSSLSQNNIIENYQSKSNTGLFSFDNYGFRQYGDKITTLSNGTSDQNVDATDPFAFNTSYGNIENIGDASQDNAPKAPFSFGGMNRNFFSMF